jgi:hypothetical protein
MTYQVKSFKILQTSVMAAVLYFILSLVFVIPMFLISLAFPHPSTGVFPMMFGTAFMVFLPFLYAVLGFIFTAIGCLIYNVVANFLGGVAFTLEEIK